MTLTRLETDYNRAENVRNIGWLLALAGILLNAAWALNVANLPVFVIGVALAIVAFVASYFFEARFVSAELAGGYDFACQQCWEFRNRALAVIAIIATALSLGLWFAAALWLAR